LTDDQIAEVREGGVKASSLTPKDFFDFSGDVHMMCVFPQAVNLGTGKVVELQKGSVVRKLRLVKKMILEST